MAYWLIKVFNFNPNISNLILVPGCASWHLGWSNNGPEVSEIPGRGQIVTLKLHLIL